jgi:cytochrome c553
MTRGAARLASACAACALGAALSSGCQRLRAYVPGVDPAASRGVELASHYGCVSCHEVPGAPVTGRIGPPLAGVQRRAYLAGGLPNTPAQMVAFIRFPNRERPGILMPDVGVSEPDARELAAFLYALR